MQLNKSSEINVSAVRGFQKQQVISLSAVLHRPTFLAFLLRNLNINLLLHNFGFVRGLHSRDLLCIDIFLGRREDYLDLFYLIVRFEVRCNLILDYSFNNLTCPLISLIVLLCHLMWVYIQFVKVFQSLCKTSFMLSLVNL